MAIINKEIQSKRANVSLKESAISLKNRLVGSPWQLKVVALVIIVGLIFGAQYVITNADKSKITYETETVKRGELVTSISGSGTISAGNYTNVQTKSSGIVSKLYVTNGDKVKKGQKIAEVALDDYAVKRQSDAWVSYLNAKEDYLTAIQAKTAADIAMWQAQEEVLAAEEDLNNDEGDTDIEKKIVNETLDQKRQAFDVAAEKYKNADAYIANANIKVASALRDYQENSATIVSPADGIITDLALAEGITVTASSKTSETSGQTIVSPQTVGKINNPEGQLVASVNLAEVDVIKVKANQKVALTMDTYDGKTFTGRVMAVNTSGTVSSNVTSYPVTILLDPVDVEVYPNMAVSVEVVTEKKEDVLLVSSTAVQNVNKQSSVQVMKDGKPSVVIVELGLSNDTQTEIVSGLSEGDVVITRTIDASADESEDASSPFGGTTSSGGGKFRMGGSGGPAMVGP